MLSERVRGVVEGLQGETARFITALIDAQEDGSSVPPRALGTGWFLEDDGNGRIVTAAHVISQASNPARVGFSRDNGALCVRPESEWALAARPADLAFASLWPTALQGHPKSLLPRGRVAKISDGIEHDVLFVHGFPGRNSFVLASGVALKSHGLATAVFPAPFVGTLAPRFLIAYSSEGARKSDGSPAECPDPRGMSGSPVWRANWTGNLSTWSPERATVIGVAVEWGQDVPALVVEPIERLHEFMSKGA